MKASYIKKISLLTLLVISHLSWSESYLLKRAFPNRVPLSFMDEAGHPSGFETELLAELIRRSNVNIKEDFSANTHVALQELRDKEIDLVMSAVSITDERKRDFDFTEPYLETNPITIITTDENIHSFADLADKKVAVTAGTTHERYLKELQIGGKGEVKVYETTFLALKDVIQGKSVAVIGDEAFMAGFYENYKSHNIKIIMDESFKEDNYGIAIRKDHTELKEKLNAALAEMKSDGSYQKLLHKWYPSK